MSFGTTRHSREQLPQGHIRDCRRCEQRPSLHLRGLYVLSYLTMKGKEIAPSLVLNSVSNIHRAVTDLREHHIGCVRAFLDNDEAGRRAMQVLQSAGMSAEDMSRTSTTFHVRKRWNRNRRKLNRLSNGDFADKANECNYNQVSIGYP